MKLTILTENMAGGKLRAEHGLSYYIDVNDFQFIFDTGHSNLFLQNAKKLGIDLIKSIDYIVLSHGHWDHGDGLRYIDNKHLICHPGVFQKRFREKDKSYIGLSLNKKEANEKFQLKMSSEPHYVNQNIIFPGEIPRIFDFEAKSTTFIDENGKEDYVVDDSGVVIIENNELIVITGCAHAGVCNTIEYAKKVTGITKIKAVMGGFHLKDTGKQTQQTIQYLKTQQIKHIYPSHCTELPALALFYNEFHMKQLKTGMILNV